MFGDGTRAWGGAGWLGLLLVLGACGGASGTQDLADRPIAAVRATPAAVVFGRVPVGAAARQTITLTNEGRAAAPPPQWLGEGNVACDAVSPSDHFCVTAEPGALAPGASAQITVTYFPSAESPPESAAWSFGCGEGCRVDISARGSAVTKAVDLPDMIDFGRAHPGCTAEQVVLLTSTVDVPLEVRDISVEADRPGIYRFVPPRPLPFLLEPGEEVSTTVGFTALDGDMPAILRFRVFKDGLGLAEGLDLDLPVEIIGRGDASDPPCS